MKVPNLRILVGKFVVLLSFLLLLCVLARFWSFVTWCFGSQWHQLTPSSQTVGTLMEVLEERGINYQNVVEKSDLVRLVEQSGQLTQDETEGIQEQVAVTDQTVTFLTGRDFYKQAESSTDTAWLVMMLVSSDRNDNSWKSPLKSKAWSAIVKSAGKRKVRVGVLHCVADKAWCKSRKVDTSRLVLLLPQRDSKTPSVSIYTETFASRQVYRWMLDALRSNIRRVLKPRLLHDHWLTFRNPLQQPETHVVLITGRPSPEPFFTAVAARFPDLAKFAWLNLDKESTAAELEEWTKGVLVVDSTSTLPLPMMLVANSEAVYVYGQGSRRLGDECFTERCLVNFLIHLRPTKNAGFSASVVAVIILAVLEIFITDDKKGVAMRMFRSGGICFLATSLLWATLSTDDSGGMLGELNTLAMRLTRYLSLTSVGAYIRHDVVLYTNSKWGVVLLIISVPPAAFLAEHLTSKFERSRLRAERERSAMRVYDTNIREGRPWYASTRPLPQLQNRRNQNGETADESERESGSESERRRVRSVGVGSPLQGGPSVIIHDPQNRIVHLNDEGLQAFLRYMEQALADIAAAETIQRNTRDQLPEWSHGLAEPPEVLKAVGCEMCVICREEFSEGDSMTGLPCRHIFHRACVVQWLNSGIFNTCPLCRN